MYNAIVLKHFLCGEKNTILLAFVGHIGRKGKKKKTWYLAVGKPGSYDRIIWVKSYVPTKWHLIIKRYDYIAVLSFSPCPLWLILEVLT